MSVSLCTSFAPFRFPLLMVHGKICHSTFISPANFIKAVTIPTGKSEWGEKPLKHIFTTGQRLQLQIPVTSSQLNYNLVAALLSSQSGHERLVFVIHQARNNQKFAEHHLTGLGFLFDLATLLQII
jgi:hypothetical protein